MKIKKLLFASAILCTCCFCACSVLKGGRLNALQAEESKKVEEKSNEIIRCLTENDREGFRALFCEQIRQSDSFDREVDAVFDFFSCDTYIKAEVQTLAGGGASIEAGERTEWYVRPEITYIEILQDTGNGGELADRYYGVSYFWQITDTKHPELEGLHHLEISLLNTDESAEVGTE